MELFDAVAELPADQRGAFLESSGCSPDIVGEVQELMAKLEASGNASAAPDAVTPERIGRYVIQERLGQGGMGHVLSALDTELGRQVALKFLSPEVVETRSAMERLIREAKAASALNHPHIVTVYEVVHSAGDVAIAMELVEGEPLRTRCGEPQPMAQVVDWGRQVAEALAVAHARNIVHRDIKPENLMVRSDGYIKVLDFGLARQFAPAGQSQPESGLGLPAGTLNYMAPEQTRGETATSASDIFSLGIVLYELATGKHPFRSDSPLDTAHAIAHAGPMSPSALNPRIPPTLNSLLLAMLAKDPQSRPSAVEVDRTLSTIERSGSAESHASERSRGPAKRAGRYALAAVGLVACLACALALWLLWKKTLPPKEPVVTQLTTQASENRVTAAAISPDGKSLAFAELGGPVDLRRMSDGFTRPLSTPSGLSVQRIAWFANGSRVLVSGSRSYDRGSVWAMPVSGGTPKLVISNAKDAVPSPDGTQIAFTDLDSSAIWVAGLSGQAAREVRSGVSTTSFSSLIWSPDSKRIAYQRQDYKPGTNGSWAELEKNYAYSYESVEVATGRVVASAKNVVITSDCGLPDGRVLFLRWISPQQTLVYQFWELRTDPRTGQLLGPPRQLTHRTDMALSNISASNDGKQVVAVVTTNKPNIYVADLPPAGQAPRLLNIRRLTFADASEFPHAWTRDSRTVIFESNRNGQYDLYEQNIDQREPKLLVESPGDHVLAQLSPDGRWILYRWDKGDDRRLMRVSVDGGTPEPVRMDGRLDGFRCPLKAGTQCVLRTVEGGQFVFHALDPVEGEGPELARTAWSPEITQDWDVSPDGSQVAIPNHNPHDAKIRLVALRNPMPGVAERTLTLNGLTDLNGVAWVADGRGLYVSVRTNFGGLRAGRLLYVDLQGRSSELLDSAIAIWLVPSPDARHVAFPEPTTRSNAWLFHGF